jgi:hypothetical protein
MWDEASTYCVVQGTRNSKYLHETYLEDVFALFRSAVLDEWDLDVKQWYMYLHIIFWLVMH